MATATTTATTTATVELVTAAPVPVPATAKALSLWERLALSPQGAILTNSHRELVKYMYGEKYRIRLVKDQQGPEKAHQWGRVWFTPWEEDEES